MGVERIQIDGVGIEYELLGEAGAPAIALTPGGRFSKESAGLRELAQALVAGGRRVLLWDRPNCGASDISFAAESESELHGRTLTRLLRALDLAPATLAGGSAGSRVSLIAASRDPDAVSALALWWISGGVLGLMNLAMHYCGESATAASREGMAAVADLPCWAEQTARNPKNRDVILAQDPDAFIEKMQRWASFFTPTDTSPVPGMTAADFARLTMPVLLFRNGKSDLAHTRRTSEWVHEMIPGSRLVEPPWPDDEWNRRTTALRNGSGRGLFEGWPALAPALLEFTAERGTVAAGRPQA
jgi:pimeloyl-ACP methyl ester carboxylesterase